ncbi:curli assembly protein CsgF [Sulfitobacter sp. S190]|uniref:curli assembly protein CsgF n=1 Tax=Sulfitobacter sp. S190 TaxID=2867022 RepID=UPI0021A29E60|nr:curli assembly protein CsgF [Sulfitobacter sp. S190]UWR23336.1 hypothetical protein K3756_04920 [Sulfitobacter sp. S190]
MRRLNRAVFYITFATAISGSVAQAENLNFGFNNPNFGGNPNNGAFLFGIAEAQRSATINDSEQAAQGGGAQPGIGGGGTIGGPTIVIPIGNVSPDTPVVGIGGTQTN